MRMVERVSPGTTATLEFRGRPFGVHGGSRFALYQAVASYRLDGEEQQITTPVLITDPEDEQFWPGQSRELYDRLPGIKELVAFTAQEGANRHCEPMARSLRETRIFDWLESFLR
jgi:hypothetical protein